MQVILLLNLFNIIDLLVPPYETMYITTEYRTCVQSDVQEGGGIVPKNEHLPYLDDV